ncbi:nickel-dependent hydrogenase large subunit [Raineyella sp. LH-20]|uniref:nickel-dependent hydrogenase large subunit n=1 Tax=Raineyella sp. LH-20 TaxID=3081204 RepID=UPI002954B6D9|nr:nickel-dependent hydrogenase large subunit [Raineyella sp. LH-20]WOP18678.1 nickel-dependent hydrogenase large subunit [Raineyella sp. LH-20]
MTQRWVLDEIVDPFGAKVVVDRAPDGTVREARFDLAGLPRVDPLLTGHLAAEVPSLVERLCGVCPAAHHLAGIRALESLAGGVELPVAAVLSRQLLHHASAISTHAVRAVTTNRDDAMTLRRLAKQVMTAVGSPGHFPATAVPGGVATPIDAEARDRCRALVPDALAAATRIADRTLPLAGPVDDFPGADVALADEDGRPDLLGSRLRAVAADGRVIIDAAPVGEWDGLVAESMPGDSAPRPYLIAVGPEHGQYRVGPVAQLRIGRLTTPRAAALQDEWSRRGGHAAGARTVITVHSVEVIAAILDRPELLDGRILVEPAAHSGAGAGVGIGWVDGPRGLLVHRYRTVDDGRVGAATVLTPTAQNEYWLALLLRRAVAADRDAPGPDDVPGHAADRGDTGPGEQGHGDPAGPYGPPMAARRLVDLEDAIREADPCLPCSSAPAGAMGLVVEERASGAPGAPSAVSPRSGDPSAVPTGPDRPSAPAGQVSDPSGGQ